MLFQGDAGRRIKQRLTMPERDEDWYVVCIAPKGFWGWSHFFAKALKDYNVNLKWIYHSASDGKTSDEITAQWRMNYFGSDDEIIAETVSKINEGRNDLKALANAAHIATSSQTKGCGSLQFYQSRIVHYFLGFMAVPRQKGKRNVDVAPDNTICLIQPYPMWPQLYGDRWGIYLDGPSKMLNSYYKSFITLFHDGVEKKFIEPVDPATMQPKGERKK